MPLAEPHPFLSLLAALALLFEDRAWIAVAVMAAATAAGILLAGRTARHAALVLLLASGTMLTTVVVDLVPETWHESVLTGVPGWLPFAAATLSYVLVSCLTRHEGAHPRRVAARSRGAHAPGRHRRIEEAAGVLSAGLGAATALAVHRVVEGTTLALVFSVPVCLALLVTSAGNGLALGAMLHDARQPLGPWLLLACLSPAAGVLAALALHLSQTALPLGLALVAGIVVRLAVIGFRVAARKRAAQGLLARWHLTTVAAAALATGALLIAAH
ncbi:hypothetical protein [Streptomyces sp. NBC_01304]|uniref:hypothetical protein n=1 Tax=Streptomyces sp. NBC_01304 TaxID=2903818 RepID=UPI002E1367E1|nr:hypothetical protein OG430_09435 [Streptomyces sp. NBC_01304]